MLTKNNANIKVLISHTIKRNGLYSLLYKYTTFQAMIMDNSILTEEFDFPGG